MIYYLLFSCFLATSIKANPYLVPSYKLQQSLYDCQNELQITLPKEPKKNLCLPPNYALFNNSYACLNRCTVDKAGILTTAGVFNAGAVSRQFQDIGIECNRISLLSEGTGECDRAHNFTVCLVRTSADRVNQMMVDCANETNTQLNWQKKYNLLDFHSEKSYLCLNRCLSRKLDKFENGDDLKVDVVKAFAPPTANVPEIITQCTRESQSSNICEFVVRREMCVNQRMRDLGHDFL